MSGTQGSGEINVIHAPTHRGNVENYAFEIFDAGLITIEPGKLSSANEVPFATY